MVNKKVPLAILSCFLIAFILQGVLKLSGIFIFEKALDWQIFEIIDNSIWLSIIYYSIISFICAYFLSFALTTRLYSNKWYHYLILIIAAFSITTLKLMLNLSMQIQIICDVIMYIMIPVIINITTNKKYKLYCQNKLTNTLTIISIQVLLYFCYLGLCYWSTMLNSIIPLLQQNLYASTMLLIFIEVYIGLICLALSLNILINKIKKENNNMLFPVNIASNKAKEEELKRVKEKQQSKKVKKDDK